MNAALSHPGFVAGKAAAAALVAWAVIRLFSVPDALSATFVAVVCVSPTVFSGLRRGLDQLAGSAVGAAVVWALALVFPTWVVVALGLLITIWVTFKLGFSRGYLVAAFTVLYLEVLPRGDGHLASVVRLVSVAIGVASALVVNAAISLPLWRSVFSRRLGIVSSAVATQLTLLGTVLRDGGRAAHLFDEVFPLLRALREELWDAVEQSRVLGRGWLPQLRSAVEAVEGLLAVSHFGRDLALRVERHGAAPEAAAAVAALAEGIRGRTEVKLDVSGLPSEWREVIRHATEAWEVAARSLRHWP